MKNTAYSRTLLSTLFAVGILSACDPQPETTAAPPIVPNVDSCRAQQQGFNPQNNTCVPCTGAQSWNAYQGACSTGSATSPFTSQNSTAAATCQAQGGTFSSLFGCQQTAASCKLLGKILDSTGLLCVTPQPCPTSTSTSSSTDSGTGSSTSSGTATSSVNCVSTASGSGTSTGTGTVTVSSIAADGSIAIETNVTTVLISTDPTLQNQWLDPGTFVFLMPTDLANLKNATTQTVSVSLGADSVQKYGRSTAILIKSHFTLQ